MKALEYFDKTNNMPNLLRAIELNDVGSICSLMEDFYDSGQQSQQINREMLEALITKYEKEWDKYGMGSSISYSSLIHDLKAITKAEQECHECKDWSDIMEDSICAKCGYKGGGGKLEAEQGEG